MKEGKILLPPGWIDTNLALPSPISRGTNAKAQFLFRYNKAVDQTTFHKYVLSYSSFFNLTPVNLPKNAKTHYERDKKGGSLILEFEDSEKRGFHFQQVTIFLTISPSTPTGQHAITERSFTKTMSVVGPIKLSKSDWIGTLYRFPTPEETKQAGTVPIGPGRIPKEAKESYEKQYIVNVA